VQGSTTITGMSRVLTTSFSSVYPHYVTKVEKKGRTKAEVAKGKSLDRILRA